MNKLLLVVGAIFLICIIVGYKRGFLKILASLISTIAIIVLVTILTPYVSEAIRSVTPIEEVMQEKCIDMLIPDKSEYDKVIEDGLSDDKQRKLIEESKLPKMFQDMLIENNNDEVYEFLGVTTFGEYVGTYFAKVISDIVAFLVTLLIVAILVKTLLCILGVIGKLPVIGGMNRVAGGIIGIGTGLILVWVLFLIITVFYDNGISQACMKDISDSKILQALYDSNLLTKYITKF